MRKILLASTALVAFAGAASAEVGLSGMAEMGVFGGENIVAGSTSGAASSTFGENIETQFFTDIDVTFTLSGETDSGISFGASIDLDESTNTTAFTPGRGGFAVFISGDFGTLTMGDTDGALDVSMQEVGFGASIGDDHTEHAGYRGSYLDGSEDGQILRYDYTFSGLTLSFSVEMDDDTDNSTSTSALAGFPLNGASVGITGRSGAPAVLSEAAAGSLFFLGGAGISRDFNDDTFIDAGVVAGVPGDIVNGTGFVLDGTGPGNNELFVDGFWQGYDGLGTFIGDNGNGIGIINTLLAYNEAVATDGLSAGSDSVDGIYAISTTGGLFGRFNGDVATYTDESDPDYAFGARYTFDIGGGSLTVGGGYQQGGTLAANRLVGTTATGTTAIASGTNLVVDPGGAAGSIVLSEQIIFADQTEIGISAQFASDTGFTVGFQYSMIENAAGRSYGIAVNTAGTAATVTNAVFTDAVHYGIGGSYEFDAITVSANYGMYDYDSAMFEDRSGFGLAAAYDLGGGLSAHLGYGYSEVGSASADRFSLGMAMSF